MSAATEEAERVEVEETPVKPAARHHSEEAEAPTAQGTPYGQIALGLVSVLTLASLGLYNALGPLGLAAGGAAATAGAAGYGAHRYRLAHPRKEQHHRGGQDRKTRSHRESHGAGRGKAGSLLGAASRSGRGAAFSMGSGRKSGGTSPRVPSVGRAARVANALGKRAAAGGSGGKRMKFAGHKGGSSRKGGHGNLGGAKKNRKAGRAAQAASTPLRTAGRAVRGQVAPRIARARAASRRLDERTGRVASRTARRAARGTRAAGGWVDRRTGKRVSTAWAAARTGGRRAATAALSGSFRRWDAQATAALVALVAWMAGPFLRRRARKNAAKTEAPTTRPKAESPAESKSSTEAPQSARRRQPYTARTESRRNHMSAFPLAAAAAEVNAAAASHSPADMFAVARELDLLGEVPANVAMALRTYTMRLQGDYPIHPAVVDAMGQLYAAHAQLVQAAEEIGPLFRRVHAEDLKREEAPRTNEQAWNV